MNHQFAKHENCLDCPNHEVINDPDPHDSFCDDDKAIVCKLLPNNRLDLNSEYLADRNPHKIVEPSIRPYNLRKEGGSPAWCPLKQGPSPAKA